MNTKLNRRSAVNTAALVALFAPVLNGSLAQAQPAPTSAARDVNVTVQVTDEDGHKTSLADQQVEVNAGHLYVPLRTVVEKMGYVVDWDNKARTVVVTQGDSALSLPVGGRATINGNPINPGAPAYLSDGKIMVPLRFMAEMLGARVRWSAADNVVRVSREASVQVATAR